MDPQPLSQQPISSQFPLAASTKTEDIVKTGSQPKSPSLPLIFSIIIVLLLVVCIFLGFLVYRQNLIRPPHEAIDDAVRVTNETISPPMDPTVDWKTYSNPTQTKQVLGIMITQCCSCPTMVDTAQIGKDGWALYDQKTNYANQRPEACSMPNVGACAPCPPLTTESYTCPESGWVDCMPEPETKPECSPEAMTWYKANCPNFQGGAL